MSVSAGPRCRRRQEPKGPPWTCEVSMNEQRRARLIASGVAVVAPAVTLLVRWPLDVVLGDRVLYMAFFPAVLLASYFGGFWPALLAPVLSALAATYFLVEPLFFP